MGFKIRLVVAMAGVAISVMVLTGLAQSLLPRSEWWLAQGGIVALAALAGWGLARLLGRPLAQLRAHIEAIERDSDLARRLPVKGKDEWSDMARALNRMFDKFNRIIQRIMDETSQAETGAEETP